ncbi:MAG: GNAT family protein [Rhodospirillales bacterium]
MEPVRPVNAPAAGGRAISSSPVDDPAPRPRPAWRTIAGRVVDLEPLDADRHAADLWDAAREEDAGGEEIRHASWTWLPYGPFADAATMTIWIGRRAGGNDPLFFAVREKAAGRVSGFVALLNIRPQDAVLEIGHIWLAPRLQRTTAATEAIALMLRHGFDDLGYRRIEWKCNACNIPSRNAALRFGFVFEGVFFRHMIVKGHNRDTAWYSLLADEWPARRAALDAWLRPENFDAHGRQRTRLARAEDPGRRPADTRS